MRYYREIETGDYLCIWTENGRISLGANMPGMRGLAYEGRATVVEGLITSIATTAIGVEYLRTRCKRVAKRLVPGKWIKALG